MVAIVVESGSVVEDDLFSNYVVEGVNRRTKLDTKDKRGVPLVFIERFESLWFIRE